MIASPTLDSLSVWDNLETFEEEVKAAKTKSECFQLAETEKVIKY